MSSGKEFPPRLFARQTVLDTGEKFFIGVEKHRIYPTWLEHPFEYLSVEEHTALLQAKDDEIKRLRAALNYIARDMAALEIDCAHDQCDTYVKKARKALYGDAGEK